MMGIRASAPGVGASLGEGSLDPVRGRLEGRKPRDRREASDAGRPAARELIIFLSAYSQLYHALTCLVVEVVLAPPGHLLRLDGLAKLKISVQL
jgi:hypothetical protein